VSSRIAHPSLGKRKDDRLGLATENHLFGGDISCSSTASFQRKTD